METLTQSLSAYETEPHRRTGGKPMPNLVHGLIQANLVFELKTRYRADYHIASEVSLATSPDGTTPHVIVYPNFAIDYQNQPAKRVDAPLLCIEIQSPSQSNEEMIAKTHIYFQFGSKSCWIVLPSLRAIMVFDRPGHYVFFYEDDTLRDPNTGFDIPLTAIFA